MVATVTCAPHQANQPVFAEDQLGDKFYLIVYGRLEVRKLAVAVPIEQEEQEARLIRDDQKRSVAEQAEQEEALRLAAICDELGASPLLTRGQTCLYQDVLDFLVASTHAADPAAALVLAERLIEEGLLVKPPGGNDLTEACQLTRSHETSQAIRLRSSTHLIQRYGHVVARLNTGQYFGEIALVRQTLTHMHTYIHICTHAHTHKHTRRYRPT
jgi:CRP-like cAMP-binding protein